MSLFRLATLMAGVVVSAIVGSFAGQRTLAEPVEPQDAGNNPSQICYAETFSSSGDSSCPMGERETDETARARAYLIATASPGYTMTRQGPERAIGRLHPAFVNRLAAAIAEARAAGLSSPEFSRPTGRLHLARRLPRQISLASYLRARGRHHRDRAPGTPSTLLWHEIAARHG